VDGAPSSTLFGPRSFWSAYKLFSTPHKTTKMKLAIYYIITFALSIISVTGHPEDYEEPSKPYRPPVMQKNTTNGSTKGGAAAGAPVSCGSCCFEIVDASSYSELSSFYSKVIDFDGFLVASSAASSDAALYEAALTLAKMTKSRPDLLAILVDEGVHLAVIGQNEKLTDIPEYAFLGPDWDWARGVGATQWVPVTSCAEENLLCLSGDVYAGENICIHETAHTLQGSGGKLETARAIEIGGSENLDNALQNLYAQSVTDNGLWSGTYAATNHEEYWAEGVQSFHDANIDMPANTRSQLESYDSDLHSLISRVFPPDTSTFTCPGTSCDCSSFQCPIGDAPTKTPTTNAPTTSFVCTDSTLKMLVNSIPRTCSWAAKKKNTRCSKKGVASHCPKTCGPASCNTCQDSGKRFAWPNSKKKRGCKFVARANTETRCDKTGVTLTCQKTCGYCS